MTLDELIQAGNFSQIEAAFRAQKPKFDIEQTKAISQYNVSEHDIFNEVLRPNKKIVKDTGQKNANDEPVLTTASVNVARVGVPFQKIIITRRVGFMLSDPVKMEPIYTDGSESEVALVKLVERIQNDNKTDYKNKEIARRMMSEMECAEIWYFVENPIPGQASKFSLKMKILSPDLGDSLFPYFDETGDMIAFARGYKLLEEGKEVEHYDIYTPQAEYKYVNRGGWKLEDTPGKPGVVPNPVGKIMAVYYSQKAPEWNDVQSMIDRFETIISNHADTNDYFGSPILTVIGEVLGYAQKGETGKILELSKESQASYLALSSEPESVKMEQTNLEKLIYTMSQTPDITFGQMKDLGSISGVALKLLFLDAHMAVKNKEEDFGIGLQRRINILKAAIGTVLNVSLKNASETVQIKPVITPYLPANETEMIENLVLAYGNNLMSQETAVEQNPLVNDPETEAERMKAEGINSVAGGEGFIPDNTGGSV